MATVPSTCPIVATSAPTQCTEQLREQQRSLCARGSSVPRQLVVTCVEDTVETMVTRLAPCLRVRVPGLALDGDLRDAIAVARAEMAVSSVILVAHTRCDHRHRRAAPLCSAQSDLDRARRGRWARIPSAAVGAAMRFADARADLRARLLALRDDACLVGAEVGRAACFGVLYVAESGVTHVYPSDADRFALVG